MNEAHRAQQRHPGFWICGFPACSPAGRPPQWARGESAICCAQAAEAAELSAGEALELPPDLDFGAVQLSAEDAEKLAGARPANLAAAQRIPGALSGTGLCRAGDTIALMQVAVRHVW